MVGGVIYRVHLDWAILPIPRVRGGVHSTCTTGCTVMRKGTNRCWAENSADVCFLIFRIHDRVLYLSGGLNGSCISVQNGFEFVYALEFVHKTSYNLPNLKWLAGLHTIQMDGKWISKEIRIKKRRVGPYDKMGDKVSLTNFKAGSSCRIGKRDLKNWLWGSQACVEEYPDRTRRYVCVSVCVWHSLISHRPLWEYRPCGEAMGR